jgi:hypothetical protein
MGPDEVLGSRGVLGVVVIDGAPGILHDRLIILDDAEFLDTNAVLERLRCSIPGCRCACRR